MLEVSAIVFLGIIECLLITSGVAGFLLIRLNKMKTGEITNREERERLKRYLGFKEKKITELSVWKEKFDELQQNFDQLKDMSDKLKELIASLVPEAEKSKAVQQLLSDAQLTNKELDTCIGTLKNENKSLDQKISSYKEEMDSLTKKLANTVKKSEHEAVVTERNRLEMRTQQLERQIKEKSEELNKLAKEHIWLEKEYNSLYDNINEGQISDKHHQDDEIIPEA